MSKSGLADDGHPLGFPRDIVFTNPKKKKKNKLTDEEKKRIEAMPYEEPSTEKIQYYGKPLFGNIFSVKVDWDSKIVEINGIEIEVGQNALKHIRT